jgi:hypothetical protein
MQKSRRSRRLFRCIDLIYLRFFLAAARAAFFLARVRAPLRAEALR